MPAMFSAIDALVINYDTAYSSGVAWLFGARGQDFHSHKILSANTYLNWSISG